MFLANEVTNMEKLKSRTNTTKLLLFCKKSEICCNAKQKTTEAIECNV